VGQIARQDLIGVGWRYPVRFDLASSETGAPLARGRGGIAFAREDRDIEQAIFIILSTARGERRMRPTFGCDIHTLVFAPINPTTLGLMHQYVSDALTMWEPRIDVTSLELQPVPDAGRVDIEIEYMIRSTKDERTLVYPFYAIREEQP
jgi:phage baseplate assembly protein W